MGLYLDEENVYSLSNDALEAATIHTFNKLHRQLSETIGSQ